MSRARSLVLATACVTAAFTITYAQSFPVRDVSPPADRGELAVSATDAQGNAMFIWSVTGPTGAQLGLRSRRYSKTADSFDAPVDVITIPAAEGYGISDLVIGPGGNATAVGIQHFFIAGQGLTHKRIVAARFIGATGQWGPFETLSPAVVDIAGAPAAEVDAAGNVTVVWWQASCLRCGVSSLYAARPSTGSGWTTKVVATDVLGPISEVKLDGAGNALVVAGRRATSTRSSLDAWRYSVGTGLWTVSPGPQVDADGRGATLAMTGDGRAVMIWTRAGGLDAAFFNTATSTWSGVQTVSSSEAQQPSVATDQNGNAIVTWSTPFSSSLSPQFLTRRYSSGSGVWGPQIALSTTGFWGRVVMTADGNATAVWNDRVGATSTFRGARYDATAGAWSGALDLASSAGTLVLGQTSVDAANGVRTSWTKYEPPPASSRVAQTTYWPAGAGGPSTGPPGAPLGLRASVIGNNVTLTWDPPTSGAAPTGYTLVGRVTSGGPVLGTLPVGTSTSFSVNAPDGTFVLTVYASNAQGTGPESATVTVTAPQVPTAPPGAPSNLVASVNGSTVTFTWSPPSSGGPVEGYMFLAGSSPSFTTPLASLPLGPSTSFTGSGVPPGTYWVRILAQNAAGSSGPSNETSIAVEGLTAPGVPAMSMPIVTGQTVTLSWTPGPGGAPTSYTLFASSAPGGAPIASAPMTTTGVSYANVPNGTYYLRVTASNAAGSSAPSADVAAVVGPPTSGSLLPLVNAWRNHAGVPPLVDEPAWSSGATLHGRYVVAASNSAFSFEGEDPRHPSFTTAGNEAGQNSILFYSLFYANFPAASIVSSWARSPFVSVQMFDPRLQRTGLGYATISDRNVNRTTAVFDVVRGLNTTLPVSGPTTFPRNGGRIVAECPERASHAACGSEGYPPVLTQCGINGNGFTTPDFGMPVWIQFGSAVTPVVTASSLSNGSTLVPVCTVTADSYQDGTPAWQVLGRKILRDRGAVILVPKVTLPSGRTYTASVTVNGQQHQWTFDVKEP